MAALAADIGSLPIALHIGDTHLVVGKVVASVGDTTRTDHELTVHLDGRVEFDPAFAAFVTEHQAPPPRET